SEPCTSFRLLGREEAFEDPRADVGAHADPGVTDLECDIAAWPDAPTLACLVVIEVGDARPDRQRAALRHGVPGVDGQVKQHLLQLTPVGPDRGHSAWR